MLDHRDSPPPLLPFTQSPSIPQISAIYPPPSSSLQFPKKTGSCAAFLRLRISFFALRLARLVSNFRLSKNAAAFIEAVLLGLHEGSDVALPLCNLWTVSSIRTKAPFVIRNFIVPRPDCHFVGSRCCKEATFDAVRDCVHTYMHTHLAHCAES